MRAFTRFSRQMARAAGSHVAFVLAGAFVIVWAASGSLFGYSDTWQLVINTGTSILTFLMIFLVQHTQNEDTEAIKLKLDRLRARHSRPARLSPIGLAPNVDRIVIRQRGLESYLGRQLAPVAARSPRARPQRGERRPTAPDRPGVRSRAIGAA